MRTTPHTQRRNRYVVTTFILSIIGICAFLTIGVSSRLNETREEVADWHTGYQCIDVLRGDLIQVTADNKTNLVRILGLTCPPPTRTAETETTAAQQGIAVEQMLQQGITARKTLLAWIYKRRVNLTFPKGTTVPSDDPVLYAYVSVFGVDVARKMLQGGQGFVSDENHPRKDEFMAYEQEARRAELGLWHIGMPAHQSLMRIAVAAIIGGPFILALAALHVYRRGIKPRDLRNNIRVGTHHD